MKFEIIPLCERLQKHLKMSFVWLIWVWQYSTLIWCIIVRILPNSYVEIHPEWGYLVLAGKDIIKLVFECVWSDIFGYLTLRVTKIKGYHDTSVLSQITPMQETNPYFFLIISANIESGHDQSTCRNGLWGMSPSGHCWNYLPGALSCSQVLTTHLNIGQPEMKWVGAWNSFELPRLDLKLARVIVQTLATRVTCHILLADDQCGMLTGCSWGVFRAFKKHKLWNLRVRNISTIFNKNNILQCMGSTCCVKFHRYLLKCHIKYYADTLEAMHFMQRWNSKSS